MWEEVFEEVPQRLSSREKGEWLATLNNVVVGSDGYFPFRDNIDRARRSGAKYVVQPGDSLRDEEVIAAGDEYGMTMVFSGVRLFHH